MYYTSNVAYKKTKMIIDLINIAMAAVIVILFAGIIFWHSMSSRLFPAIFVSGAIVNLLTAVKSFLNWNKKTGIVLGIVAIVLLIFAAISWTVAVRSF